MKGIRNFLLIIVRFLLFVSLFVLILSYSFEGFVESGVSEFLKNSSTSTQILETVGVNDEKIVEVIESEEVQEFIAEYADDFIEDIINGQSDDNIDLGDKILEYVREHKSEIEEIIDQPLDMTKVEEVVNSKEFDDISVGYNQVVEKANDFIPPEVTPVIKTVKFLMSDSFKGLMIVSSIIFIILIALLQWSLVEWIRTLGRILVICGISVFALTCILSLIYSGIANMFPLTFSFNFMTMFIGSVISFVSGLVLTSGYKLGVKIFNKKKLTNV